jgi:hypothetical protein
MSHALRPPINRRSLAVPLVAAVLGAGAATAAFAIADDPPSPQTEVVFQTTSTPHQTAQPQLMGGRRP